MAGNSHEDNLPSILDLKSFPIDTSCRTYLEIAECIDENRGQSSLAAGFLVADSLETLLGPNGSKGRWGDRTNSCNQKIEISVEIHALGEIESRS